MGPERVQWHALTPFHSILWKQRKSTDVFKSPNQVRIPALPSLLCLRSQLFLSPLIPSFLLHCLLPLTMLPLSSADTGAGVVGSKAAPA